MRTTALFGAGLREELQVIQIFHPEATSTNGAASQRSGTPIRSAFCVTDATATGHAVSLVQGMVACGTAHFLAPHFKRSIESLAVENSFAHLLFDPEVAQGHHLIVGRVQVGEAPVLQQVCLTLEVHTTQVARSSFAKERLSRPLVAMASQARSWNVCLLVMAARKQGSSPHWGISA